MTTATTAQLLNRLWVKQKTEALGDEHKTLLLQAVKNTKDCPCNALHTLRNMTRATFKGILSLLQQMRETNMDQTLNHSTQHRRPVISRWRYQMPSRTATIGYSLHNRNSPEWITHYTPSPIGWIHLIYDRHTSYSTHQEIAKKDGGGVTIYCKEHILAQPKQYIQNMTDLEFIVIKILQ